MSAPKYLAWTDIETTQSEIEGGHILEVGIAITNIGPPKYMESAYGSWVIRPDESFTMPSVVVEMHTANGLLQEVFSTQALSLDKATEWMHSFLGANAKPGDYVMAGSGVGHFDKRWIDAKMPSVSKWFRYWVMDVGVIRRFRRMQGWDIPELNQTKNHRALDDARLHLEEFHFYSDDKNWQ